MYSPDLLDLADEIKALVASEVEKATKPLLQKIADFEGQLQKVAERPVVEILNRPTIEPAPLQVLPAPVAPEPMAKAAPTKRAFKILRVDGEMDRIVEE